jgi:hypothetical protein
MSHNMFDNASERDSYPHGRVISEPGATIEMKVVPIPSHIRQAISRNLGVGQKQSPPPKSNTEPPCE